MDGELRAMGKTYLVLLAGLLAMRAKASPTLRLSYDPIADAMTQLTLCLRKPDATVKELMLAVYLAGDVWSEWHDQICHFWERLAKSEQEHLEQGDLLAEIGVLIERAKA